MILDQIKQLMIGTHEPLVYYRVVLMAFST
jgi:hypothetical protein